MTKSLDRELELLLAVLPGPVREIVERYPNASEISLHLGRPLVVSLGGKGNFLEFPEVVVEDRHIDYVTANLSGLKDDGRAGIDGTAHRISVIKDRLNNIISLTVRVARYIEVLDERAKELILGTGGSILIIGAPESGKTTLLRNIVSLLAEEYGPNLSVVDTSNEIGGLGKIPHPSLRSARWHQVGDPRQQAFIVRRAIANHAPQVLVLDEVGYNEDVEEVEAAARRGIRVIASVHGLDIADVLENPRYEMLLGRPDLEERKRIYRPAFRSAIEVRAKGKLYFIPNLAEAIDRVLEGKRPEGVRLGPAWREDEPDYPEGWGLTGRGSSPEEVLARAIREKNPKLSEIARIKNMPENSFVALLIASLSGSPWAKAEVGLIAKELRE